MNICHSYRYCDVDRLYEMCEINEKERNILYKEVDERIKRRRKELNKYFKPLVQDGKFVCYVPRMRKYANLDLNYFLV